MRTCSQCQSARNDAGRCADPSKGVDAVNTANQDRSVDVVGARRREKDDCVSDLVTKGSNARRRHGGHGGVRTASEPVLPAHRALVGKVGAVFVRFAKPKHRSGASRGADPRCVRAPRDSRPLLHRVYLPVLERVITAHIYADLYDDEFDDIASALDALDDVRGDGR
jgi:hypothetical protein